MVALNMFITIGNIQQWIQIETNDPTNPALLIVHGGPGASTRFASAAWQHWRDHFTLVHWDQRGSGRTFAHNGPGGCAPMRFEQIVSDGIAVVEFLQAHLQQARVFVLGHSWGSAIAVHMVKRRPELFGAFIGTGLLVNFVQNEQANYERELAQARAANHREALDALLAIEQPPHANPHNIKVLRDWADKLTEGSGDSPQPRVKPAADFSAEDGKAMLQGFQFSATSMYRDLCAVDLPALGFEFDVPMFCLMGTHDQQTPIELAERYFDTIRAPNKAFVRFDGCHHFVHVNRPEDFLAELIRLLR